MLRRALQEGAWTYGRLFACEASNPGFYEYVSAALEQFNTSVTPSDLIGRRQITRPVMAMP